MKRLWLSGFCVCAGWFVGVAAGQEGAWRPTSPRPLAIARTEGTPLGTPAGMSLGRPQPLDSARPAPDRAGSQVVPTAFRPAAESGAGLLRAKLLEDPPDGTGATAAPMAELGLPPAPLPVEPSPAATTEILTKMPAGGPAPGPKSDLETPPAPRPVGPLSPDTGFATDSGGPLPPDVVLGPDGELMPADSGGFSWGSVLTPQGRFYGSAEYLLWYLKGANTPPLVTTSSASTPQNLQGVLGPQTAVLFGGSQLTQNPFSGGRLFLGYQFGPCNLWAVEAGGFFLGQQSTRFDAGSPSPSVIARPFIANSPGGMAESAELVASPGLNPGEFFSSAGSIHVDAPTQFYGFEANVRRTICCGCNYKLDVLAGYRYLNLSEGLHITEDLIAQRAVPQAGIGVGDRIVVTDRFDTRNQFNGGQLGLAGEYRFGRLYVGGSAKVALGNMHEVINIHGSTQITPAMGGPPTTFNSGLLALSSNSGTFSRDRFAVVPEVTLKVGYQVTDHLRAFVGYNFLYVSEVVRPGDQIDRVLNTNLIPPFTPNAPAGPPRPAVPFKTTEFWAQGLTLGVEWRY